MTWAILGLLLGCGPAQTTPQAPPSDPAQASPSSPSAAPAELPPGERWYGAFAAYPGATSLCSQHVTGTTMHILWTAYTTADPPEQVAAFYRKIDPSAKASGSALIQLRAPKDLVLNVQARGSQYPHCDSAGGKELATVIIVSQAVR